MFSIRQIRQFQPDRFGIFNPIDFVNRKIYTIKSLFFGNQCIIKNMKALQFIENWKLCDYSYCPQVVNDIIDAKISIQSNRNSLMLRLQDLFDLKKVLRIMNMIDNHKESIQRVRGIEGNSVYLLLNYGLSRSIIRDYIFGKIELSVLLFLSLEQITKELDISVYTGQKILDSCRFAMHILVDDSDFRKQETLRKDVCDFFRGSHSSFMFQEILEGLLWRSDSEFLKDILDSLEGEGLITCENSIYRNKAIYPHKSLSEVLDSIYDETTKRIVVDRLYGKTMESIGLSLETPISRGRVSQIFHNELEHFPSVKEDRYHDFLLKYEMNEETFYAITNAVKPTWGYLQEKYHSDFNGSKIPLSGEVLSMKVAKELVVNSKKLKTYLEENYCYVSEMWIDKEDKHSFLQAVCKSFDGYFQKEEVESRYAEMLQDIAPEKAEEWALHDFRINNMLKQGYLVYSARKGIRYRVISRDLVMSLMREANINKYQNTIISTKKIYEDAIDIMEKYDIRDQYELHSLLRTGKDRYQLDDNDMEFSRMPMLQFGDGNESEIVQQEIKEKAPIDVEDFSRYMANKYGYDVRSFISYLRRNFNIYIEENRLDIVDEKFIESDDFKQMKERLDNPFYFEEDYQALIEKEHLNSKLMDPYVIRRLGYKSYAGYILKEPLTPGKYFEQWILENSVDIEDRHLNLATFMYTMERLERQLDIFEWEKNVYIPLSRLHVSKKELLNFVQKITTTLKEGQYFTQKYLSEKGIVQTKLSNTFYKSLLKSQKEIQILPLGNGFVFVKSSRLPSVKEFFMQILKEQPRITITGLKTYLKKLYGISIDRRTLQEKIIEIDFYYSMDTERIYIEKPKSIFEQEHLF